MPTQVTYQEILKKLKTLSNPKAVQGMARFGINPKKTYGISIPTLRKIAKDIGKNHDLARKLWIFGIHEARILASMIDESDLVTKVQMERWVRDFDSWDVCDQVCMNLFEDTPYACKKAIQWSNRKGEFTKRAGFVMMARLAVSDKDASDKKFLQFFPLIRRASTDERNFVKKAVNWALRQIGKRNLKLNKEAIATAKEIQRVDSNSARWIASIALSELTIKAIQKKVKG